MMVPSPNYPDKPMDTVMGASGMGDAIQPHSDQEETAVSYVEASISMLKNAAESFPALAPGVQQIAQVMRQVLEQAIMGQQQGPAQPPQSQGMSAPGQGPAMPPGMM